jgi:hypothetical protein
MRRISIYGAAAILVAAVASPSIAQAACAQYDPGCATYPMPKKEDAARSTSVRAEVGAQQPAYRSSVRTSHVEQRTTIRGPRYDTGGPVSAAGAVAAGAVATAGAIATAPFRAADSYAYYNEGYGGWDRRSYAERNGFVCTPGELFKGFDGRVHVCQ